MDTIIKVENLGKQYRLGTIGTGTLSHDLNRWWANVRGKDDPYLKVGDVNDRTKVTGSEYVWALKDINFEVKQGEVLGIIGRNGAGKSTLLKILSQVTTPTTGAVKVKGRIASLLEVGTGFHIELTGKENIFLNGAILGMTKAEIKNKFDAIVEFSGVEKYIDTPVKRYSSGMMVRLGFAVAAHLEPEILIVDEVLAVGDIEFQEKCLGKMKDAAGHGRTVLFVSHNMAAIKTLCDKCILLENGMLIDSGNTDSILSRYQKLSESIAFSGTAENLHSSYKTATGKILKLSMYNNQSQKTGEIEFEENFKLQIEFELNTSVKNINIDVRILSSEGIVIGHTSTLYQKSPLNFSEGKHTVVLHFENNFFPGVYSFEVGLHFPNDTTIDYVKNGLPFKISNFNKVTNNNFLYKWTHIGYFKLKTFCES